MEVLGVKRSVALGVIGRPPPAAGVDDVCALAHSAWGLEPLAVERLPGERDQNFRLRVAGRTDGVVLKLLHPDEDPRVADLQDAALRHLERADATLPVPRVIAPRPDAGDLTRRARCVTFLEGRPLQETPPTGEQRRELGRMLARMDRALATFGHPAADRELAWDASRADRALEWLPSLGDAGQRGLVGRALERFATHVQALLPALRRQVIHNDFNQQNVLVVADRPDVICGVIDFGDMLRAPLVQDVATACAYQPIGREHPLAASADVAAGFHAAHPLTEDEIRVLPHLVAGRLALSATISARHAAMAPANARYALRNQPVVLRNIERLLEVPADDAAEWLADGIDA